MKKELTPSERRARTIEKKVNRILNITPEKIKSIENIKFQKEAITVLKKVENHIHKLLFVLNEIEIIDIDHKVK